MYVCMYAVQYYSSWIIYKSNYFYKLLCILWDTKLTQPHIIMPSHVTYLWHMLLSYVLNRTSLVTVSQLLTPSPLVLLNNIPYKLQLPITPLALNAMLIHQTDRRSQVICADRWLALTAAGMEYDRHGHRSSSLGLGTDIYVLAFKCRKNCITIDKTWRFTAYLTERPKLHVPIYSGEMALFFS